MSRTAYAGCVTTFFGRNDELAVLRQRWARAVAGTPQLVVVHGLRQVGKTSLVRHFLDSLPSSAHRLYMAATLETSQDSQLARLAEIGQTHRPRVDLSASTWARALQVIADLADTKPTAVALDEVPYLESSTPGFGSVVQAFWDGLRTRTSPTGRSQ